MDVLEISGLHKRFGQKEVLKGLNLNVKEHSVYGYIGKNGAGKTTSMKLILGLLSQDSGEIRVCGEKVAYGNTPTNRHVGYLPDVPEFYPFMTAGEYLSFCMDIALDSESETGKKARIAELLELVGLDKEKSRIRGFSRGMKQRLGIAQALIGRPELLICDEPTSALDPIGRKELLEVLRAVKDETTVLFSTHILSDMERICTDVAFLNDGVVKKRGSLADIKTGYRSDRYIVEAERTEDFCRLLELIPGAFMGKHNQLEFSERETSLEEVLGLFLRLKIRPLRIERLEPTLESVFLEVVEQ